MLLPSFALWPSVAGKEAIVVFSMGIIGAAIVKLYQRRRFLSIGLGVSLVIIYLFRDHFLPTILFILVGTYVATYARQRAFLAPMGTLLPAGFLYLLRDRLDTTAFAILPHFSIREGVLTRDPYWIEKYYVFAKAPYGIFHRFLGLHSQNRSLGHFSY